MSKRKICIFQPKIFVNKSTDTTEDLKFAKLQYDRVEKEN